jgi:hypothetical protein
VKLQPPPAAASADARKLADAHTVAILALLVGAPLVLVLASFPSDGEATTLVLLGRVAIELLIAATFFRLARLLGEPGPLLWALAPLVHFMLGVVVFAILNLKARRRLRGLGLDVGLLGARVREEPEPPAPDPPAAA